MVRSRLSSSQPLVQRPVPNARCASRSSLILTCRSSWSRLTRRGISRGTIIPTPAQLMRSRARSFRGCAEPVFAEAPRWRDGGYVCCSTLMSSMTTNHRIIAAFVSAGMLLAVRFASSEPVPVRFSEGLVHGFLVLSAADGTRLAEGDLKQTARGDRVTSRLVFHFADGSLHDDTAVFTERRQFGFVSEHLVQKGPSFPQAIDMSVDASGQATVQYTDDHGTRKTASERLKVPPDLANGRP